jgi:signal transduction histidine kinase
LKVVADAVLVAAAPRSRTVADLVTSRLSAPGATPIGEVVRLFERNPEVDSLAVVNGSGEGARLVSRARFFLQLGKRFGYSLFENRPVDLLAEEGSTVEASADPVEVIQLATQREDARIYDDILVLQQGRYVGTVSMRSLLAHNKDLLLASLAEVGALDSKYRELQELNRLQAEFMANVTHELRSPVNAILGLLQVMGLDAQLPDRHQRTLSALRLRAQDLATLIDNVLDAARLEAGALEPILEDVPLEPLLLDVLGAAEALVGAKPVEVRPAFRGLPPTLSTDAVYLKRILTNLLSNAVKFTDSGHIALHAAPGPGCLVIQVSDTGAGIPPQDLPRLFERFVQGGSARQRRGGTGLGLTIVKGLLAQLGGSIEVASRVGVGTTFTLRLPTGGRT